MASHRSAASASVPSAPSRPIDDETSSDGRPTVDQTGEWSFPANDPPAVWTWEITQPPTSGARGRTAGGHPRRLLDLSETNLIPAELAMATALLAYAPKDGTMRAGAHLIARHPLPSQWRRTRSAAPPPMPRGANWMLLFFTVDM
jgi:hypothetical protein